MIMWEQIFEWIKNDGIPKEERNRDWKCLILGHGPTNTIETLEKIDPKDYDLIITCHDDCNIYESWGSNFNHFITLGVDKNESEINYAEKSHKNGIHFIHPEWSGRCADNCFPEYVQIWRSENLYGSVLFSGLACIHFIGSIGFNIIHTLGLDWTYCEQINRPVLQRSYMNAVLTYGLKNLTTLDNNGRPSDQIER